MKKMMLGLMLFSTLFTVSNKASANDLELSWTCDLEADLSGFELGLGVSIGYIRGEGSINCSSIDGRESVERDIKVMVVSYGGGAGFGLVTRTRMVGVNIGVANIDDLIGQFKISLSTGVTLIAAGIEPNMAIQANTDSLSFELGFMGKEVYGLGYFLRGNIITISEA